MGSVEVQGGVPVEPELVVEPLPDGDEHGVPGHARLLHQGQLGGDLKILGAGHCHDGGGGGGCSSRCGGCGCSC